MIKIRYEYTCDICKSEIRPVEEYECALIERAYRSFPQPRELSRVAHLDVCEACLSEARNVLIKKYHDLNDAKPSVD